MRLHHSVKTLYRLTAAGLIVGMLCSGCGNSGSSDEKGASLALASTSSSSTGTESKAKGTRDNTPRVLTPSAPGTTVFQCSTATIDASNTDEGYVTVSYSGSNAKVKLQITGSDGNTYTYNLSSGSQVFPLSSGSGSYTIGVFENVSGNQYATALSQTVSVNLKNTFGPFLYPNQYVNFNKNSAVVAKASELAAGASSDLDVVSNVYNYIIKNVAYDHAKADGIKSGYVPDVDATLSTKKGICLDYAGTMAAMLRSQSIPTRMEVGYAGTAYHAWISTYIKDVGWVNGIIQFDGKNWELMDPTFAANSSESSLKKFIGEGDNYTTKYYY